MKCIVKKSFVIPALLSLLFVLAGCNKEIVLEEEYQVFETAENHGVEFQKEIATGSFFAEDFCVGGNENILDESVSEHLSEAAGLFQLKDKEILFAKNIHEKLYPASTTKILTAYVAIKYGDLQETTIISEKALELEAGSTTCGLSQGDQVTLEQLLYGLMLCSGNDAANAIAEMVSGSIEEFASLMNQEAFALGATNSHFVNPHGLHNEEHYTTVYDLYLIFSHAMENHEFRKLVNTAEYHTTFQNKEQESVSKEWKSTNRFLIGEQEVPENVKVIGGKTGTTNAAGHCLVLYSESQDKIPYVSIVLRGVSRDELYYQMTELLKKISN